MGIFDIFFKRRKGKKAKNGTKSSAEYISPMANDDREFLKDPEEMQKAPQKTVKKPEEKKSNAPKEPIASAPKKAESAKPHATDKKTSSTKSASTVAIPASDKVTPAKAKPAAPVEVKKAEEPAEALHKHKPTRSGKFEIKKSKDGRFVFNLYASNNVIIATSQIYSSASSAMVGIKSVIANSSTAPIEDQTLKDFTPLTYPKWEIYLDKSNQYRFRLCASNGSCVCHSQGYTAKSNCKKGIDSIVKFAADAEICKAYLDKD